MQLLKKHGIIVFWLLLFADCYLIYAEKDEYHAYLKVLLIPVLGVYIFKNAKTNHYFTSKIIVFGALLFSWIGDLLFLKTGQTFLLWGLLAYAVAYLFYTFFFFRLHKFNINKSSESIVAAIVMIGISVQLLSFIKNKGGMPPYFKVPVIVGLILLSIMTIAATNIFGSRTRRTLSINFFIPGAFLFVISQAILAINEFVYNEHFLQVAVIMSYGYAQCLIAQGITKYMKGS